jgi:hypothetical protein
MFMRLSLSQVHVVALTRRAMKPWAPSFLLATTWRIGLRLNGPGDGREILREVPDEIARVILRTEYERRLSPS